ncbi:MULTISPECIES: OmpH family outer membrane protein [Flavobacterium]|uniref:OmpH family outer membrane protein n=1 Tax=Flavobacterium hankyongi TaxID=1176532 RepID=A0ABP8ZP07_9FLAO|nr:OmpH family outer membrane protein [Flavobacterium sp. N1846]
MKKIVVMVAVIVSAVACNKTPDAKEFKTAYIDTQKLMEDYTEAKELDEKYKTKGEVMGRELEVAAKKLKVEMDGFQKNAMAKGQMWAQQKGAELQQREQQLGYAQQAMLQQLQQESGKELDTIVKQVKVFIKDYGKQKGYDYIYGTGDAATVLYAKDSYDITGEITKALNEKYESKAKKSDAKEETKKEEKK